MPLFSDLRPPHRWWKDSGEFLDSLDQGILAAFVVEVGFKLYAQRLGFFRDPWNVFDFLVVGDRPDPRQQLARGAACLAGAAGVLRLISIVPRLHFVVEALLRAVPGISSAGLLMLVLFYVFLVMATGLFGGKFPEWFGTIGDSIYTLFQIMTLESWSMGIVRPVMAEYPCAWLFLHSLHSGDHLHHAQPVRRHHCRYPAIHAQHGARSGTHRTGRP